MRLSYYAARAARSFQSTRRRKAAKRALPLLERYYGLLRPHSGERFDPAKLARLELHWWQLRRENSSPPQYGEVIAQVQEELYGVRDNQMKQAALLRAEMMGYRDERHNGKMQSQDWTYIDDGLQRSYQLLKTGLNTASRRSLGWRGQPTRLGKSTTIQVVRKPIASRRYVSGPRGTRRSKTSRSPSPSRVQTPSRRAGGGMAAASHVILHWHDQG